uniref:Uncharacterized protein n=1 Tax=Oryza barthii TaxID=65489 RepID=A0A0D3H3E7_9ORYZ
MNHYHCEIEQLKRALGRARKKHNTLAKKARLLEIGWDKALDLLAFVNQICDGICSSALGGPNADGLNNCEVGVLYNVHRLGEYASLTWTKAWLILAVLLADASKAKDLLMDCFWGLNWPKTIDLVTYIISSATCYVPPGLTRDQVLDGYVDSIAVALVHTREIERVKDGIGNIWMGTVQRNHQVC